jgi:hypothetical protein
MSSQMASQVQVPLSFATTQNEPLEITETGGELYYTDAQDVEHGAEYSVNIGVGAEGGIFSGAIREEALQALPRFCSA